MIADPDPMIEQTVEMPIVNPDTKRSSRSFIFMGKVDRVDPQLRRVRDWKGVAKVDRFLRELRIGYQAELYVLALQRAGVTIIEIEYCLITRPTIEFTKCRRTYAVMRAGRKSAVKLFDDQTKAETFATLQGCSVEERIRGYVDRDAYEKKCVEWLLERPERLVRHAYTITPHKLTQAAWFLWDASKRVLECRRFDRWIPNVKACYDYERECPYADLCEAVQCGSDWQFIADEWYEVRESSHPELKGADDGRPVLTHTSLSDLTRCEMYYQWKHEKRLRKRCSDDSEALWIGSAMHAGMEAYATGGEDAAGIAIDAWADGNPVLGEDDTRKQDQQIARARAMARAAAQKWGVATDGDTRTM
jgi:hypothetical protein